MAKLSAEFQLNLRNLQNTLLNLELEEIISQLEQDNRRRRSQYLVNLPSDL